MTSQDHGDESRPETMFERWQQEQLSWQRLVMDYVDKATTDEVFLTNLGNAMRGSLLANKPYPGAAAGAGDAHSGPERSELDGIVFALRRVEGQLLDLTMAIERTALVASTSADTTSDAASAARTASSE